MDDARKANRSQKGCKRAPRSRARLRERIEKNERKLLDLHTDDPLLTS